MTNREKEEVYVRIPLSLLKELNKTIDTIKGDLAELDEINKKKDEVMDNFFNELEKSHDYFLNTHVYSEQHDKWIHEDEACWDERNEDFTYNGYTKPNKYEN